MQTVVKRTIGFVRDFAFTAEATVRTGDGFVTVREGGHTAQGAMARVACAAKAKLSARRWACGFLADGFKDETRNGASFAFGFA